MTKVIRQVVEATDVSPVSIRTDLKSARRAFNAADEGLRLARQRQEFGVGVVLENILAEQDLTRSRTDYLKAIAEFNKAQYELSRATGVSQPHN